MIVETGTQHAIETTGSTLASGAVRLTKSFQFEAAHRLPHFPQDHKCYRLHGHSFKVDVICEGRPHPKTGILVDFSDIKKAFKPFYDLLDHHYLNEVEGLENPTSENLAVWIWQRVKPHLPQLAQITVHETCSTVCEYRG